MSEYHDAMNGIRAKGCECWMHQGPRYHTYDGPQPAEWEMNPECSVHGEEVMTASDPAVAAAERALDNLFNRGQVARALNEQVKGGALEGAREALIPLRELHRRWSIYGDDCNHTITDDPYIVGSTHPDGKHHYVAEIGWTCDHQYDVCAECCVDDIYQSEDCANYHQHGPGKPICDTAPLIYPDEELS